MNLFFQRFFLNNFNCTLYISPHSWSLSDRTKVSSTNLFAKFIVVHDLFDIFQIFEVLHAWCIWLNLSLRVFWIIIYPLINFINSLTLNYLAISPRLLWWISSLCLSLRCLCSCCVSHLSLFICIQIYLLFYITQFQLEIKLNISMCIYMLFN